MKHISLSFLTKTLLVSCYLSLVAPPVFAAEVSLDAKAREIKTGRQFEISVYINAGDERINAVEGKIAFPSELLEAKGINEGNSVVSLWVEKPRVEKPENSPAGEISFSGIIPGGYGGERGLILSAVFLAKKSGFGAIRFDSIKALKDDGRGTETEISVSDFQFVVSDKTGGGSFGTAISPEDKEPPETFMPQIAADPAIFDGKWFLVFAAGDKGSGIDRYEVCEGKKCFTAESPYLLKNQNPGVKITVKAIDKSGNERAVSIRTRGVWYKSYAIFVILALAVAYLIRKRIWRKREKPNF